MMTDLRDGPDYLAISPNGTRDGISSVIGPKNGAKRVRLTLMEKMYMCDKYKPRTSMQDLHNVYLIGLSSFFLSSERLKVWQLEWKGALGRRSSTEAPLKFLLGHSLSKNGRCATQGHEFYSKNRTSYHNRYTLDQDRIYYRHSDLRSRRRGRRAHHLHKFLGKQ